MQMRRRSWLLGAALVAWLAGCAGDLPSTPHGPPAPPPIEPPGVGEIRLLTFETYDGSGEVVHPDVPARESLRLTPAWFLVLTPYPNGNAYRENPSVFASRDVFDWHPPAAVQNPIARPHAGYLSDPDVVYDPDARTFDLYYRGVDTDNAIHLTRSSDGVSWTAPVVVARAANHDIVSPAVVRRAVNDWWMWSVRSGSGCEAAKTRVELRHSTDGLRWSAPRDVQLSQPGFSVWHLDVQWIPARAEYWAIYNVKTPGTCATPALYLATSVDGERWSTHPSPVLARGALHAFDDIVYRSTFDYDPATDLVTFWYSGARYDDGIWVWRAAVQQRQRKELFASLDRPAPPVTDTRLRTVPPLLIAP